MQVLVKCAKELGITGFKVILLLCQVAAWLVAVIGAVWQRPTMPRRLLLARDSL